VGPNYQLLSLRAGPAHQSAISTWCHASCHPPPGCHGAARRAIKARSDRLPCPKPTPEITGTKPRAPTPARERSAIAVRAHHHRSVRSCLHSSAGKAATPHHLLPICAGAQREELPYRWSFDRRHRHDPLHGERSPERPPLLPFSPGIAAHELPLPSHPDAGPRRQPKHPPHRRTPPPSLFFCPFPSVRSSGELPPSPTCLAGGPSTMDARAPHISHGSVAAGHAATCARSAVTASVRACASCQRAGRAGRGPAPPVGCGHHCAEATGWAVHRCVLAVGPSFSPLAFDLFLYFMNIFKSLQIQNFV
jgi:hypothetical protein